MNDSQPPSSREELEGLHEEGKITDEEYDEILNAMTPRSTDERLVTKPEASGHGLGKIALILAILGILVPVAITALVTAVASYQNRDTALLLCVFLAVLVELVAMFAGFFSWRSSSGKAAVAVALIPILALIVSFIVYARMTRRGHERKLERVKAATLEHQKLSGADLAD